jgi:hypothetical protein
MLVDGVDTRPLKLFGWLICRASSGGASNRPLVRHSNKREKDQESVAGIVDGHCHVAVTW